MGWTLFRTAPYPCISICWLANRDNCNHRVGARGSHLNFVILFLAEQCLTYRGFVADSPLAGPRGSRLQPLHDGLCGGRAVPILVVQDLPLLGEFVGCACLTSEGSKIHRLLSPEAMNGSRVKMDCRQESLIDFDLWLW